MKPEEKRLILEIPERMHKEIKIRATERGISIKTWVMIAIQKELDWEDQYNDD